ncbi:hypothetical protein ON010_g18534 [Phytophthora cinnamomi]|nr:hypothetical protein ON010_g18534 [Phytophthora cinnamomi]
MVYLGKDGEKDEGNKRRADIQSMDKAASFVPVHLTASTGAGRIKPSAMELGSAKVDTMTMFAFIAKEVE